MKKSLLWDESAPPLVEISMNEDDECKQFAAVLEKSMKRKMCAIGMEGSNLWHRYFLNTFFPI